MRYKTPDLGLYATPDDGEVPAGGYTPEEARKFLESVTIDDPLMDRMVEATKWNEIDEMIVRQPMGRIIEPPNTLAERIRRKLEGPPDIEG
ncbi:MAG: hypothetical protein KJ709_02665 [Nanoarchaeota archaeon]|nr:hypothetical protein [Nanoarchaeota archaeon]